MSLYLWNVLQCYKQTKIVHVNSMNTFLLDILMGLMKYQNYTMNTHVYIIFFFFTRPIFLVEYIFLILYHLYWVNFDKDVILISHCVFLNAHYPCQPCRRLYLKRVPKTISDELSPSLFEIHTNWVQEDLNYNTNWVRYCTLTESCQTLNEKNLIFFVYLYRKFGQFVCKVR